MRLRVVIAVVAIMGITGCTSADYQERMDYLRQMAKQGAETHALLASQEALIDKARCERAYAGIGNKGKPDVTTTDGQDPEAWEQQVKEFFVDSCVSGKPKPVPSDATQPSAVSPASTPSLPPPSSASSR
jgi:hypothetical protein